MVLLKGKWPRMMSFLRSEKKDNGWAMSHAKDDEKVENPSNFSSTDGSLSTTDGSSKRKVKMKKKMTTMNVFSVWNCKNAQINDLDILCHLLPTHF